MCGTCGCSEDHSKDVTTHHHHHPHDDHHHGGLRAEESTVVRLEQDILAANDRLAAKNRQWFRERDIVAVNFLSSPGSGKTTLLERLIADAKGPFFVIQGDQATDRDAERVRRAGARAIQINTGTGCHLDATMVERALSTLDPARGSTVFIENVGNLVCPALFDLGESLRVVIASVTEGEDKPLKYPYVFRRADVVILNKADLLPHLDFDLELLRKNVLGVNPDAAIVVASARTGEGLNDVRRRVLTDTGIASAERAPS